MMTSNIYTLSPNRGVTFPTLQPLAFKTYHINRRERTIILKDVTISSGILPTVEKNFSVHPIFRRIVIACDRRTILY